MKLLSFIEDQEAELLDITEDQLRLRVGRTWWERCWYGLRGHAPLEIRLDLDHGHSPVRGPSPARTFQPVENRHCSQAVESKLETRTV